MPNPVFFTTPKKLNDWFSRNGARKDELLVGFYKKDTGRPSIDWPQSVDEALCYGWIDGIRRKIDEESYSIRFTPRRQGSTWSARNIERVAILTKENRMRPAGLEAFSERKVDKSAQYAYEQNNVKLKPEFVRQIRANKKAWTYFDSLAPSYKNPSIWWIVSAKKEETRLRRLAQLIECSAAEQVLPQFMRPKPKRKK